MEPAAPFPLHNDQSINQSVVKMKYAVRGELVLRANALHAQLQQQQREEKEVKQAPCVCVVYMKLSFFYYRYYFPLAFFI